MKRKLQVPLLWDSRQARFPSESSAGRHAVYGYEAAAHATETKVDSGMFPDLSKLRIALDVRSPFL